MYIVSFVTFTAGEVTDSPLDDVGDAGNSKSSVPAEYLTVFEQQRRQQDMQIQQLKKALEQQQQQQQLLQQQLQLQMLQQQKQQHLSQVSLPEVLITQQSYLKCLVFSIIAETLIIFSKYYLVRNFD